MTSNGLITQAAYARHRGVTKTAVHAAVQSERIRLVNGKVDVAQADRDWAENTDAAKQVHVGKNGNGQSYGSFSDNRKKREGFEAKLAELRYLKESGQYGPVSEFSERTAELGRRGRKMLLAVPDRLGAVLGLDAAGVRLLRREMEIVCREIGAAADE